MTDARPPLRLRRQLVWTTALATAVGVALLTLLTQVLLGRYTDDAVDTTLTDRATATVKAVRAEGLGDVESQLAPGTVVYDAQGVRVAGRVPTGLTSAYDDLAKTTAERSLTDHGRTRLMARSFRVGGESGTVVVSEPLAPYEHSESFTLAVCVVAGVLMVALATGLASWVSRRALAPVDEMARTAREWSRQDLGRRFDLGPPTNEITGLGTTLDLLLDRVATAIRAEERLTSELAHELRTPLTTIHASAELALLGSDLGPAAREEVEAILAASDRMAETVTGLLELARNVSGPGGECRAADAVAEVLADQPAEAERVTVAVADDLWVALPQGLVARALGPVVQNALRLADEVQVEAEYAAGQVRFLVTDDGPGVEEALRDRLFEPGVTSGSSAGLGLALARRIARNAGGDVTVDPQRRPTRFEVRLPGHQG